MENTWGLTFGQYDDDEATEVAVGSKQGWVAVFDGETEEMQWKYDMDGSSGADSLCYSLHSADLDGSGIDELIVPQQNKLTFCCISSRFLGPILHFERNTMTVWQNKNMLRNESGQDSVFRTFFRTKKKRFFVFS